MYDKIETLSGGGQPAVTPSNGTNRSLVMPGFNFTGGVGTQALNADWTYYTMMLVPETITLDQLAVNVTTAAGTLASVSIHAADTSMQPSSLVLDAGTIATNSTGIKTTGSRWSPRLAPRRDGRRQLAQRHILDKNGTLTAQSRTDMRTWAQATYATP